MARVWDFSEVSPEAISRQTVAVIGYGNQGRPQALNLRDSGIKVLVGNRPDDAYAKKAREDGFEVLPIGDAAQRAEIVLLLLPDEIQPELYGVELEPVLRAGQTLGFASGYNVAFDHIRPATGLDLVLVAPRMIGRGVLELPQEGRGFPVLIGVEKDVSGQALATCLAIAAGIGAGKPGGCIVESSFREEAVIDLFTEHTWAPAAVWLLKACCELLIEEGVSPEAAILEIYASGELGEVGRAMSEYGLAGQMRLHSHTSQFGHLLWGEGWVGPEVRERLREALRQINDGSFAEQWRQVQQGGLRDFHGRWERLLAEPIFEHEETVFRRLRRQPSRQPL